MRIAFCTAVMNRRWQLERTLSWNLERLRGTSSFLVVVDFNSRDDVDSLVRNHEKDIRAGSLVFFRTSEPSGFHSSRSKNLAHRLALSRGADVVFNLDADNFLSRATLDLVGTVFSSSEDVCLHNWSALHSDGTSGRIALRADTWAALGGYDESLAPVAWQDIDLLIRCRANGVRYVLERADIPLPIPNRMAAKVANIDPDATTSEADAYEQFCRMLSENVAHSMARPIRLPMAEQQRYTGTLNFTETVTI